MSDKNQPFISQGSNNPYEAQTVPVAQGEVYSNDQNSAYRQNQGYQNQEYQNQNYQPNQGYQGQQNQGYVPGNYGNMPPPPPPQAQFVIPPNVQTHPSIIIIQEQLNVPCQICGCLDSYARRTPGCAAFSWCVCLFCFTGFCCFWIPFALPRCYDVEIVCSKCQYIKAIVEANCV